MRRASRTRACCASRRPAICSSLLPRNGRVTLLERDADGDGRADAVRPLLDDLDRPHGLDFHDGWLYVAEGTSVGRIRYDADAAPHPWNARACRLGAGGRRQSLDPHRSIRTRRRDVRQRRLELQRLHRGGSNGGPRCCVSRPTAAGASVFASGLRNSVGFDWQPGSGDLYATDNGRDLLGDDFPPCELNRIVKDGFYGWPFANGIASPTQISAQATMPRSRRRSRPHILSAPTTRRSASPSCAVQQRPHRCAAPRSWRCMDPGTAGRRTATRWCRCAGAPTVGIEERDFATGFLQDDEVIGRPVDVAEGPDGAFYVSDDYAGAVYRIAPAASATAESERDRARSRNAPSRRAWIRSRRFRLTSARTPLHAVERSTRRTPVSAATKWSAPTPARSQCRWRHFASLRHRDARRVPCRARSRRCRASPSTRRAPRSGGVPALREESLDAPSGGTRELRPSRRRATRSDRRLRDTSNAPITITIRVRICVLASSFGKSRCQASQPVASPRSAAIFSTARSVRCTRTS